MELKKDPQNGGDNPYWQDNDNKFSPYWQDNTPGANPAMTYGDSGQNPYYQENNLYSQAMTEKAFSQIDSPVRDAVYTAVDNFETSVLTRAFLYMFIALCLSGITALMVATSPSMISGLFARDGAGALPLTFILFAEFGTCLGCQYTVKKNMTVISCVLFVAFAILNGITLSIIFLIFKLDSIVTVFFMSSAIFLVMAVYGAVTKKDLAKMGPILTAGLIAIILGSLVNMFLGSSAADYCITISGILLFTLFTVYDVNQIVRMSQSNTGLSVNVLGLYGGMQLYLDFINIFIKLLRLFGRRRWYSN